MARKHNQPTDIQRKFAERIKAIREQHSLTQEVVAELTSLSRNYIGYIECNNADIGITNIFKFAMAFEMTVAELLTFPESEQEPIILEGWKSYQPCSSTITMEIQK